MAIYPANTHENVTCSTCALCQMPRSAIIGFLRTARPKTERLDSTSASAELSRFRVLVPI
ncbi:hypothetical protein [Bradyrhizobium manausense]|uniref:hypothetical protein n=1 Tax=Bradyrhizobium manausense TaxID=989370 RepID=UPI003D3209B1